MKKKYGFLIIVALIVFIMLLSGCARGFDELREENDNLNRVIEGMTDEIDSMRDKASNLVSEAEENWELLQKCIKERQTDDGGTAIVASAETIDMESWTLLDKTDYDLTGDGAMDEVKLYTSALKDDSGNIMWDDGQFFIVLVQAGEKTFELFNERIQIGRVYYSVFDGDEAGLFITVSTYAGIRFEKFTYSSEDNNFTHKIAFDTDDTNIIHSNMPWD